MSSRPSRWRSCSRAMRSKTLASRNMRPSICPPRRAPAPERTRAGTTVVERRPRTAPGRRAGRDIRSFWASPRGGRVEGAAAEAARARPPPGPDTCPAAGKGPHMAQLAGKVALVTGGASGIGRAIVDAYAREGAKVAIVDLSEEAGREAVQAVERAGGEATFVRADVSRPEDNERMVRETVERFGALHVACNNAGIGGEVNQVADYSVEGWQKVIAVNLSSVFYAMKHEIPAMLAAGGGAIVNVASILGAVGWATSAGYVAAKHGVVGLTRTAALEYAAQGVRVNAIGPAFIKTPLI